jgi:DNA-binding MarR family transcriptional regulator
MRSPARIESRTSAAASVRPASTLPLPTLLSQVLVAFTVEFDNEAERQLRHRTTRHGVAKHASTADSPHAPWLVSLAMWSNCMQFVGEEGVTVRELEDRARTKTNLDGMKRWGYIVVEPNPADKRLKPPRPQWIIRATPAGRKAQEVWRLLFGAIEKRWQARFGQDEISQLVESLRALIEQIKVSQIKVSQIDVELPDCLPILGYGLFSRPLDRSPRAAGPADSSRSSPTLSALLSQVLLAFAIEFERHSDLSLAISTNVVRVLDKKGVRIRDLPLLTGVSKEAISMAMGILQKRDLVIVEPDQTGDRAKVARLTPEGRKAQDAYLQLLSLTEERWQARFGKNIIRNLRTSLEQLVGEPTAQLSPLFLGLEPHPDGWRASVRKPDTLPHYPMVLHRGGFPDGS